MRCHQIINQTPCQINRHQELTNLVSKQLNPLTPEQRSLVKDAERINSKGHKGHDVVTVKAARRIIHLCRTCSQWLGKRKGKRNG